MQKYLLLLLFTAGTCVGQIMPKQPQDSSNRSKQYVLIAGSTGILITGCFLTKKNWQVLAWASKKVVRDGFNNLGQDLMQLKSHLNQKIDQVLINLNRVETRLVSQIKISEKAHDDKLDDLVTKQDQMKLHLSTKIHALSGCLDEARSSLSSQIKASEAIQSDKLEKLSKQQAQIASDISQILKILKEKHS